MKNSDVKKYIKALCHDIDMMEDQIQTAFKMIKNTKYQISRIKDTINSLSEDVAADERNKVVNSYLNQYHKTDLVVDYDKEITAKWKAGDGTLRSEKVPLHKFEEINEDNIFNQVQDLAKVESTGTESTGTEYVSKEQMFQAMGPR